MGPEEALEQAARTGLLPARVAILLAVSGGADSMALLHAAWTCAPAFGWRLAVGHAHHGWRGREADRDLLFVGEHARRLALPFFSRRGDARSVARRAKLSPEAGARHFRYEALQDMAREAGSSLIATAHQRDDRLECLLLARQRRGGTASAAGPRIRRDDGVVRPMLDVSRAEVLAFLRARGVAFRRDASNGDLRLDRNRARRDLALLTASGATAALEDLRRQADRHASQRDRVDREFESVVRPGLSMAPGCVVADAGRLASCSGDAARRALEEAARPFARPGHAPLTGSEREQILARLAAGCDFRFEAGRRILFERLGPLLRVTGPPQQLEANAATAPFPVSASPASYYHSPITPQRP